MSFKSEKWKDKDIKSLREKLRQKEKERAVNKKIQEIG